jgi:hypothetical protein
VGVDAVVSALGIGTSRAATIVYSGGIKNIVSVMGRGGPKALWTYLGSAERVVSS